MSARLRLALLAVLVLTAGVIALSLDLSRTVAGIEEAIRSLGPWGVAASIGLMVLHSFLPFPAEVLALCNGMIWGWAGGTVVTWVGAMLGAATAFGIARALGRPVVERFLPAPQVRLLDTYAEHDGWWILLLSRLMPLIAFNVINYAAGLTRIGWWTFAWTTGLGILPVTIIATTLGDGLGRPSWQGLGIAALVAAAVGLCLRWRHRMGAP